MAGGKENRGKSGNRKKGACWLSRESHARIVKFALNAQDNLCMFDKELAMIISENFHPLPLQLLSLSG